MFDAWQHQIITLTNVDIWSVKFCGIHMLAVSDEMFHISMPEKAMKIVPKKIWPDLPGANEVIKILFGYVKGGLTDDNSALVQVMAWSQ